MPKDTLERTAENGAETVGEQRHVTCELPESNYLANIRRLSDRLMISSRHQYSKETFTKTFEMGFTPNLQQTEPRPSHGTTVSIYGLREAPPRKKWDTSTVCFLIAAIAVTKLEVSFSIRDEERKKVVLRIAKPHSPVDVLRTLFGKDLPLNRVWSVQCGSERSANYHGYVGLSDRNATRWIFLNHRPIHCPLILKLIGIVFKERLGLPSYHGNIFILFFLKFSQREFTLVTEGGGRNIMFYDMQTILSTIKRCAFKCLGEEATLSTVTPYLCKTQLLKRIHVKQEKSVFANGINGHKNVTSSMMENKIMIGVRKRTITVTTNYFNKRRNIDDNIESTNCYIDKKNDVLSSTRCQTDLASVKRSSLYKDKAIKETLNGVDKTQASFLTFDITDNSTKSDEAYNCGDNNNDFVDIISPLSEWSNWTYYTNNKKRNPTGNTNNIFSENDSRIRQLLERNNQFAFLPRKLYGFLQRRHGKLTNVKCFNSPNSTIPFTENGQHEQIAVHPCKLKQKLCEFRLSRASLKYIKIINQVNDEFIAAWMTYDGMEILLMIDQHAVHERIRYENLLLRYKVQNETELLSVNLRDPLSMEFPTEMCNLFLRNKILLRKYGISLGTSKENTLLIRTIPQCLITNSDPCNFKKLLPKIHGLLKDVLKNRNTENQSNALPLTIHNAIASEACHGAIKFGDKLTLEQCTSLIKLLEHTKFPNRCAHGRPTIIPVMEFSELGKRSARPPKKKLNFASLRRTVSLE